MKKALCFGLAAVLAFLFCGCANKPPSGDKYTLYLNGKAVSSPLTVERLGRDYSVELGFVLNYKDTSVAGIIFYDDSKEQDELKKPVKALVASQFATYNRNDFAVGGIVIGNSEQDVVKVFGEPTEKDETINKWTYSKNGMSADDYYLGFSFDDYGKITYIYFFFDK